MRRGAKPKKRRVSSKSGKSESFRVGDLEKRLAEALEQQTATSEILQVIHSAQTDTQSVFDAISSRVVRLCDAFFSTVWRYDGTLIHHAADNYPTEEMRAILTKGYPAPAQRGSVVAEAISESRIIHIEDLLDDSAPPASRGVAIALGYRTLLCVPMLRDGASIGAIAVARREQRPFSDPQIKLVQTFADQAVIAIENTRLFNETKEALEQQTATSEILRVISSSPTDVQPVFDTIAERAMRLCDANQGLVGTFDGEQIHLRALANFDASGAEAMRRVFPIRATRGSVLGRTVLTKAIVQIPSMLNDPEYQLNSLAEVAGFRGALGVPMLKDGNVVGAVAVTSPVPRVFADREIALLQTFADQAVIAIENVRLFTETKKALERQTATSEILRVISSSPTDTQPVFDVIAANAARLCGARDAQVLRVEGDVLRLVSAYGSPSMPPVRTISRGHAVGRAVIDRQTIHVRDMAQAVAEFPETSSPQHGVESLLAVPLLREDVAVGVIRVSRTQIQPFTEQQIALLQTFADQAVIAIENVRLFTELQEKNSALTAAHAQVTEALEQQTATAEILRVISGSPTDVQPVFETIAKAATTLCVAENSGVFLYDGTLIHFAAHDNWTVRDLEAVGRAFPRPPGAGTVTARAILTRAVAHTTVAASDPAYELVGFVEEGVRTILSVPMLKDGDPIGAISVTRRGALLFTDRQITLLKTFADQAVIAIENVRLFTELQASNRELTTALDTQTATSDILRVISRSQTDVQPVFDAILASAVRLLGAYSGSLTRSAGDQIELAALTSTDDAGDAAVRARYPQPLQSEDPQAQILRDRAPLNIADAQTDPRLPEATHAYARARGWRSAVMVPMLRHGEAIGTISVTRRDPGGFTDDEIALLETFADQAVIAIENVRLFTELQEKNRALTEAHARVIESLEQQTATAEVLRVISGSPTDLQPVFDSMLQSAVRLLGGFGGAILLYDGSALHFGAVAGGRPQSGAEDWFRSIYPLPLDPDTPVGRAILERRMIQLPDTEESASQITREVARGFQFRAVVTVPMLREGSAIGTISITRAAPGEFAERQVEVLQTFADQAVIAIENVRLFKELEARNREIADKSRQLEVASQHKSEFLANMSHELRTPLNAVIGFSEVLGERMFGDLNEKQDEYLKDIHASGQHLLSLINDILDLSKIEAGRMELELTDFDLPQAIDNALTLVRERASRRGIALHQSVEEHLGEIKGDERKVKQVLLNLLSNALKFTPEGGRVEVLARVIDGMAEISVTDTGVGIAAEDQEAVFEEFRQVGTAVKKAEGTGLGLTLCRKFIELHGGKIWVTSQVGVGSTFTFTIPLRHGE